MSMSKWMASLFAATFLFPNYAAADVAVADLIVRDRVLHTHPDDLTEEALPIVHDCPQVAATIRAEEMTEVELTTACAVLKKTEDRYHAKMQTDPRSPVRDWYDKVEILMFNNVESMNKWFSEVFGRELTSSGVYYGPIDPSHDPWTFLTFRRDRYYEPGNAWQDPTESRYWNLLKHEYVHHLDATFHQNAGCVHLEGVAEYFSDAYYAISVIGDGSDLPSLMEAWYSEAWYSTASYLWAYLIVRFLFEEHPEVMLELSTVLLHCFVLSTQHMSWHAMVAGLKAYYIQSVTHCHKHCTCTQMNVCDHMTLYNEKLG